MKEAWRRVSRVDITIAAVCDCAGGEELYGRVILDGQIFHERNALLVITQAVIDRLRDMSGMLEDHQKENPSS